MPTLVNGGLRVRPSIVERRAGPAEADRVVSARTSARDARDAAPGRGARHRASSPTCRATRSAARPAPPTSRTRTGGYASDKVISTFAGVLPGLGAGVRAGDRARRADQRDQRRPRCRTAGLDRGAGARRTRSAASRRSWGCARTRRRRDGAAAALHARGKRIARWPRTPGGLTMAGSDRTDKLMGFEALGLLTGTRRAGDWSGPLPEITGLSVDSRETRAGPPLRRAARQPDARRRVHPLRAAHGRGGGADRRRGAGAGRGGARAAGVPVIVHDQPRRALAIAASRWFGAQPEVMVAVTGHQRQDLGGELHPPDLGGARARRR